MEMKLSWRTIGACVLSAFAGGAVFAAIVIGEEGNGGHALEVGRENAPILPTHQLRAGGARSQADATAQRPARPRRPRVRYFETDPLLLDSPHEAATLQCPPRNKAIGGYLVTDHAGIVLDYSAVSGFTGPFNKRRWSFEVIYAQINQTQHSFQLGVVCIGRVA